MRTIGVDSNNDILIDKKQITIRSGLQAVLENCEQACKAQLGEMVLNQTEGVPNFQTIWRGASNIVQFENFLRRAILSVSDVTGIESLNVEVVSNTVVYVAQIKTVYGSGVVQNGL